MAKSLAQVATLLIGLLEDWNVSLDRDGERRLGEIGFVNINGLEYTVPNIRGRNSFGIQVSKEWFKGDQTDKSKPHIRRGDQTLEIDCNLIPVGDKLFVLDYLLLRECALQLEVDRDKWFGRVRWGMVVNEADATFHWEGNRRTFPLRELGEPAKKKATSVADYAEPYRPTARPSTNDAGLLDLEQALRVLRMKREDMMELVDEGRITAFRDGQSFSFLADDVASLAKERGIEVVQPPRPTRSTLSGHKHSISASDQSGARLDVKELRQRLGLTQRALADILGVTPAAVGHWECGRASPSADAETRLIELAGTQPSQQPLFEEPERCLAGGTSDFSDPEVIRELRIRLGLTQEQLAEELGVAFATVNRWENGHSRPSRLAQRTLAALMSSDAPVEEETGKASCAERSETEPGDPDTIACRDYKEAKRRKQAMPRPDEWGIYNAEQVFLYRIKNWCGTV